MTDDNSMDNLRSRQDSDRLTRAQASDASDLKLGQFVTNKWLVGTMLLLMMSMGGYIFRGIDKSGEAQAGQIEQLGRRTAALEVEAASARATQTAQYAEIINRLDRMERAIWGAKLR